MKRFKFSLASVLSLRQFRKTEAAAKLATSTRRRQQAGQELDHGNSTLNNLEDELRLRMSHKTRVNEILLIQQSLHEQRTRVTELKQAYMRSVENENMMRDNVLKAKRAYETLVKLEQKQRELSRKEAEKEDELMMQEFVSSRYALLKAR